MNCIYVSVLLLVFCGITNAMDVITDEDTYLVDQIKKETDITDYDVKKVKLLFMGELGATLISGAAGLLASYKAYEAATTYNVGWGALTLGGFAFGFYPVLYSRVYDGIMAKIKKLKNYCKDEIKSIVDYKYNTVDEVRSKMPAEWKSEDTIVQYLAFDNLCKQTSYANRLLGPLRKWSDKPGEIQKLRKEIVEYHNNLTHNRSLLKELFDQEVSVRRSLRSEFHKAEHEELDLEVKRGKASLTWGKHSGQQISNLQKGFDFIKDLVSTGWHMLEWIVENKETAVGTAVAVPLTAVAVPLVYKYIFGSFSANTTAK